MHDAEKERHREYDEEAHGLPVDEVLDHKLACGPIERWVSGSPCDVIEHVKEGDSRIPRHCTKTFRPTVKPHDKGDWYQVGLSETLVTASSADFSSTGPSSQT